MLKRALLFSTFAGEKLMSLKERITEDMKAAMRARDAERLGTIRLLTAAMKTFYDVRNLPGLKKKPSTSELLDWLKLLVAEDIPLAALQSKDDKVAVPPLVGALLKNEQDVTLFEKLVFMQRHNR